VFNVMIWPELMVVQWGFHCDGVAARWLLLAYLLCTLCTLAMVLRARTIAQRLAPFALQSFARCAILAARVATGRGSPAANRLYFAVELLGSAGGVLNGARLPERLVPGRLDVALNSHQLMHILTAACVLCVFHGGAADHRHWHLEGRVCPR
jgi:hypothetical protein